MSEPEIPAPASADGGKPKKVKPFPQWLIVLAIIGLFEVNLYIYGPIFEKSVAHDPRTASAPPAPPVSSPALEDASPSATTPPQPSPAAAKETPDRKPAPSPVKGHPSPGAAVASAPAPSPDAPSSAGPKQPPKVEPPPPADPRKRSRGASFDLLLGVALLEEGDPATRLDANQRKTLRDKLRALLPLIEAAATASESLARVLTKEQITYLNSHRGPVTYNGHKMDRPESGEVRTLLETRRKESGPAASGSPGDTAQLALDLDDLEGAPIRLEVSGNLRLSPEQAGHFLDTLTEAQRGDEAEEEFSSLIQGTLRAEQQEAIARLTAQRDGIRRTAVLSLIINLLSPVSSASR